MLGEVGDGWLVRLHMQIAKTLNGAGWSQNQIATILGSTQSTVSRQLLRTPPKLPSADADAVDSWANELSRHLIIQGPKTKVKRQRIIMDIQFSDGHSFQSNKTLTGVELEGGAKEAGLLRQLEWSCSRLDLNRIVNWTSGVGMNFASCLPEAISKEDVAAFPGRLSVIDGRIRHHEKATMGSSSSLSKVLLKARGSGIGGAIINLKAPLNKNSKDVNSRLIDRCVKKMKWNMAYWDGKNIDCKNEDYQVILGEGGFGWEPHLFVVGSNAGEVVDRTHALIDALEEEVSA